MSRPAGKPRADALPLPGRADALAVPGRSRAGAALLGGGLAVALRHLPLPGGAVRWERSNYRGETVSLAAGPALALAAAGSAALPQPAALVAGLAAGLLGAYDDAAAGSGTAKGFRGHLAALAQGRVTSGAVKLVGIALTAIAATALLPGRRSARELLLGAGVVAGSANLLNLLDVRPGRALKVGLLAAVAVGRPGPAAAAAVLLPADLGERTMLGDAGANALGAVLGLALVHRTRSAHATTAAFAVLVGLTAASEVVSFSAVIDSVRPLRALDRLGRRA